MKERTYTTKHGTITTMNTANIGKRLREERKQKIFDMWMACHSQDEIAEATGVERTSITKETDTIVNSGNTSDFHNSRDFTQDADFTPPLYNIWTFSKKTNDVARVERQRNSTSV